MARGTRLHTRNPLKLQAAGDLYIGGTSVVATAAQLNVITAGGYGASVDGSLEIATGLSTVTTVVASLKDEASVGGASGYFITAYKSGTAGSVVIAVWKEDASAATASVECNWVAIGT